MVARPLPWLTGEDAEDAALWREHLENRTRMGKAFEETDTPDWALVVLDAVPGRGAHVADVRCVGSVRRELRVRARRRVVARSRRDRGAMRRRSTRCRARGDATTASGD